MPRLVLVCDLERFTNGLHISGPFVSEIWCAYDISVIVTAFLDTFSQARLLLSCVVLQVDRSDVALSVTALRLHIALSSWGVPTPPVQAYLPPAQTVWDDITISDTSDGF